MAYVPNSDLIGLQLSASRLNEAAKGNDPQAFGGAAAELLGRVENVLHDNGLPLLDQAGIDQRVRNLFALFAPKED